MSGTVVLLCTGCRTELLIVIDRLLDCANPGYEPAQFGGKSSCCDWHITEYSMHTEWENLLDC